MKKYIAPEMEIFNIRVENALLNTSTLTPENWTGGGSAGSNFFEDEELDFLTGGDLDKLLGM